MYFVYLFKLCILHIFLIKSGIGLQIEISPNRYVLNQPSGDITVTCRAAGSTIHKIYELALKKDNTTAIMSAQIGGTNTSATLAPNLSPQITKFIVPGSVQGGLDTVTPSSTFMSIKFNPEQLFCSDAGQFSCVLNYKPDDNNFKLEQVFGSLTNIALPKDLSLSQQITTINSCIEPSSMSFDNPCQVKVGDVIGFTCAGKVGDNNETKLSWLRSGYTNNNLIAFESPNIMEGTPTGPVDCQYSTTSQVIYNVTVQDATTNDGRLTFVCTAKATYRDENDVLRQYEVQNPPSRYFKVAPYNSGNNAASVATAGDDDIGAIVGGVVGGIAFIVIVVLLVYFLWYRRRGEGAAYRTKEERGAENPNMAPDTYPSRIEDNHHYSKPMKKRGHENPTLDEPHESNADRYYENTQGRPNYGMDDDDESDYHSRDGSPSRNNNINHMGEDASFGTGV